MRSLSPPMGNPALFSSVLVRAACQAWLDASHPVVSVPDASEQLVLAIRKESEAQGARFMLGVQGRGAEMLAFARASRIPAVSLANRHRYPHFGGHWTPEGHSLVARRILALLERRGWLADSGESP